MPPWLLATLAAALTYSSQRQQQRLAQQQYDQAQRAYQQAYDQLYNLLSPILASDYSAIPQSYIEQVVGRAGEDVARLQRQQMDQALRNLARRGMAGSSLLEQQNVAIGERAQRALTDARLMAEGRAQDLTAQQQAQARSLLAGLTSQNFGAMQSAAQNLLAQASQATDTYSTLLGNLLTPYIYNWMYGGQPTTGQNNLQPMAQFDRNPLLSAPALGAQRARQVLWE